MLCCVTKGTIGGTPHRAARAVLGKLLYPLVPAGNFHSHIGVLGDDSMIHHSVPLAIVRLIGFPALVRWQQPPPTAGSETLIYAPFVGF